MAVLGLQSSDLFATWHSIEPRPDSHYFFILSQTLSHQNDLIISLMTGFSGFKRLVDILGSVLRSGFVIAVWPWRKTVMWLWRSNPKCMHHLVYSTDFITNKHSTENSARFERKQRSQYDSDIRSHSENVSIIIATPGIWRTPVAIVALAVSGLTEMKKNHMVLDVFYLLK